MAYEDFQGLAKRTVAYNVFRDKAFNIAKDPKYNGYQRELALWFINFLIKRLLAGVINPYLEISN